MTELETYMEELGDKLAEAKLNVDLKLVDLWRLRRNKDLPNTDKLQSEIAILKEKKVQCENDLEQGKAIKQMALQWRMMDRPIAELQMLYRLQVNK